MFITNCAICDKPITDETEYEKTDLGLVCSGRCSDKTQESTGAIKQLLDLLGEYGGRIVSSNSLSPDEINQARASSRMYVDENSLGYVWLPPFEFPTTADEVKLFEAWFPLNVEIPKELKGYNPLTFTDSVCHKENITNG